MTEPGPTEARAGAVLEVDLGAIVANWKLLVQLHPSGPVAGMVKADAYGLGAQAIAPALYAAGCRHFFVALLDEALALRPLLPDAMLAVLNGPFAGTEPGLRCARHHPGAGIAGRDRCLGRRGPYRQRDATAILHIDTGMSRLGLSRTELGALHEDHARLRGMPLRYVMTHLVSLRDPRRPDEPGAAQSFEMACARLPPAQRSFANSSGIFLGKAYGSDLARPGAALYGINPTPARANPMRLPVRLRARVVAVRDLEPEETVGYNATWTAARPSRIATVAIGYADGWQRAQSNRGTAVFDGRPVPLVGRVSMDLTTFDVTDHPGIVPGAWLELIGPARTPDDVAAAGGTNGYEVLTSLGRRFHRTYRPA